MSIKKINLQEQFQRINEYWSPKIAGELNGQHVKIAKVKGDFIMHHHENEDEFFLVIKGTLHIEFKDQTITLNEGEMLVVPKGVDHRPYAEEEVHLLLFEPASTVNTGNIEGSDLTKVDLETV